MQHVDRSSKSCARFAHTHTLLIRAKCVLCVRHRQRLSFCGCGCSLFAFCHGPLHFLCVYNINWNRFSTGMNEIRIKFAVFDSFAFAVISCEPRHLLIRIKLCICAVLSLELDMLLPLFDSFGLYRRCCALSTLPECKICFVSLIHWNRICTERQLKNILSW